MDLQLDLTQIKRSRALNAWLTYHGIGKSELAQKLGVDPSFITYVIQGKRRSRRVLEELERLGVPAALLYDEKEKQAE